MKHLEKNFEKPVNEEYPEEKLESLKGLADDLLFEDEKEIFNGLIEDGKVRLARMRMLSVVDFLWGQGRITDEDAKKKYDIIGFTPDEASIIRQSSVAGQFGFK